MNNNTKNGLRLIAILLWILYAYLNQFSKNEFIKNICGCIAVLFVLISAIQWLISTITRDSKSYFSQIIRRILNLPLVVKLNQFSKKIDPPKEFETLEDNIKIEAKLSFLEKTKAKSKLRKEKFENKSIFTSLFPIDYIYRVGSHEYDNEHVDLIDFKRNRFYAITGETGNGKSYELIRKVYNICQATESLIAVGSQTYLNIKVPVFLELRSLKGPLNDDWLMGMINNKDFGNGEFAMERLKWLIEKSQIMLFLDGLDEVEEKFRIECFKSLMEYAKRTTVVFTCRKGVFEDIKEKIEPKFRNPFPAELEMKLLDKSIIEQIINDRQDKSLEEKKNILGYLYGKNILWERLAVPLILNLFLATYNTFTKEEKIGLLKSDQEEFLNMLWAKYEIYIYNEKLKQHQNKWQRLRKYIVFIAKKIQDDSFYIEQIQPDWLVKVKSNGETVNSTGRRLLYYITCRTISVFILSVATGFIIGSPLDFISTSIITSLIVIALGGIFNLIKKKGRKTNRFGTVAIFVILLMAVCGPYQGAIIPHSQEDIVYKYFSLTDSYAGIIFGIVVGVFFGFRTTMQTADKDILPVEKFTFDWKNALELGYKGGLLIGVLIGIFGILVKIFFSYGMFYQWLDPFLKKIVFFARHSTESSVWNYIILFIFALIIAFSIAFFISAIVAGRFNNTSEGVAKKRNNLNYGIRKSFIHSLGFGILGSLSVCILYEALTLPWGNERIVKGIMISIGIGIVCFLWFGGIEIINHIILRLYLFFYGIAPLRFRFWVKYAEDLAFIRRSGANLQFYHKTLWNYFKTYTFTTETSNYESQTNAILIAKKQGHIVILCLTVLIMFTLLLLPFYQKQTGNKFWKTPYNFKYNIKDDRLSKLSDTTIMIKKDGQLQISIRGNIKVGTFAGDTGPEGIVVGFLGMPLGDVYDRGDMKQFRHGAILYKKDDNSFKWMAFLYNKAFFFPFEERRSFLRVKKGEKYVFRFNDKEWENNEGAYRISLSICDTCR